MTDNNPTAYALPAEYVLSRATFEALADTVAARIPAAPVTPFWRTGLLDAWRHFRTQDGRPGECLAIKCPHEWVGYAAFATASAILATELSGPPTPVDLDSMMLELSTRQYVSIDGNQGVYVYWPTLTVAAE